MISTGEEYQLFRENSRSHLQFFTNGNIATMKNADTLAFLNLLNPRLFRQPCNIPTI